MKRAALVTGLVAALGLGWLAPASAQVADDVLTEILPSGLVILTKERPDPDSVAISVAVRAGSRDEDAVTNGAAHFMEHMFFQGTPRRPTARDVDAPIGSRGGRLNATTSWEVIQFDAVVRAADAPIAIDVLGDMLSHAHFDRQALEKERRVVLQELNARLNNPRTGGGDVFFQTLFANHPARHLPAGSRETVLAITRDTLMEFRERWFVANNMVVAVVGNLAHETAVALIADAFRDLPIAALSPRSPVPAPDPLPSITVRLNAGTHQAQLLIGVPGPSMVDPDRHAMAVLDAVIDDAGRRLFTEIRDRRALAYSVGSVAIGLTDTGVWYATAGVDADDVELVSELILDEMRRLREEPVTADELEQAQSYLEGRSVLGLETNLGQARRLASQEALGVREPIAQYVAAVRAVTAADVQRVAQRFLDPDLAIRVVVEP